MPSSLNPRTRHVVYVVEPHPFAARHLASALQRNPALEVILSDINLRSGPTLPNKRPILIIDAGSLPFPLAPFLRSVRIAFGEAQILVIGKPVPDEELCRLIFHGVRGFVAYDKVEQEIRAAVDSLLRGHMWHAPQVLERYAILSSALANQRRGKRTALSARESEVIGLVQRRLSNKEIGSALGISERTVRFHLHNIFEKLGVHDRYSVLELARGRGGAPSQEEVPVWKTA
jgi:DNA-binding NarL/FixJ family response regulator